MRDGRCDVELKTERRAVVLRRHLPVVEPGCEGCDPLAVDAPLVVEAHDEDDVDAGSLAAAYGAGCGLREAVVPSEPGQRTCRRSLDGHGRMLGVTRRAPPGPARAPARVPHG